ncbi:MAG: MEDS domain-containing protein [Bacillota bacterium]
MRTPVLSTDGLHLQVGDHVCVLHEGAMQRTALLLLLLDNGLADKAKCLYLVDDYTVFYQAPELFRLLKDIKHLYPGRLDFVSREEFFPGGKSFDPDATVTILGEQESQALKEGYTSLQVAVEMTWMLSSGVTLERIVDYEKKLNAYCGRSRCAVACAYDLLRFPPVMLVNAVTVHPLVLVHGALCNNIYYIPNPNLRLDPWASGTILRHYLQQLKECAPYLKRAQKK